MHAEYTALSESDQARYVEAYSSTETTANDELKMYTLSVYTNLDYYGVCRGGTQGSAARPPSSVVDAAFRTELRRRARAPLAGSNLPKRKGEGGARS